LPLGGLKTPAVERRALAFVVASRIVRFRTLGIVQESLTGPDVSVLSQFASTEVVYETEGEALRG
jgi:hypothetical protein